MRNIILLILSLLHLPSAQSASMRVASLNFPPICLQKGTSDVGGVGIKIILELLKRAKIESVTMHVNPDRFDEISAGQDTLVCFVSRIPERENKFQWIGIIAEDRYCVATLKSSKPINSFEEAKQRKIGVSGGSSTEAYAKKNGLTNLERSVNSAGNLRKLAAGAIDGWLVTRLGAFATQKEIGLNSTEIVCDGDLGKFEPWIGASKGISPSTVDLLKKTYAEMERDGTIAKFLAELK